MIPFLFYSIPAARLIITSLDNHHQPTKVDTKFYSLFFKIINMKGKERKGKGITEFNI